MLMYVCIHVYVCVYRYIYCVYKYFIDAKQSSDIVPSYKWFLHKI